jgi:hypothetical protein
MSDFSMILPETGRGTIRRMVEGARRERSLLPTAPSTPLRAVPLPMLGRI